MAIVNGEYTSRVGALLGTDGQLRLKQSCGVIFGVGGVGSWCAEALIRTGIGKLVLIDDDIVAKALEDKAFYDESGGGVTLSGGEPLLFWEWAVELFRKFKEKGLSTCMDTSLYAPPAAIEALLPYVDMWLPDYKAEDDSLHRELTGVSNRIIKRNLERLVAAKARLEVRMLVVPRHTDGADIVARRKYIKSLGIPDESVVELKYLDYARSKYLALGMKDTMPR